MIRYSMLPLTKVMINYNPQNPLPDPYTALKQLQRRTQYKHATCMKLAL
jgi:hypothetical protein